ncbi:MAG: UDP-2,4-diacetamido-2,4,6-trideoxy-beta-L-altropyranose hydrolase, partial [bacterium]
MFKILFRVDGHPEIGLGHVTRCLTLAKEFKKKQSKIDILFLTGNFQPGIKMVKENGYSVLIDETLTLKSSANLSKNIYNYRPNIVIMDINNTEFKDIQEIKKLGCTLVTIDDLGAGQEYADLVIDVNEQIKNKDSKKYLFGSDYVILREEFLKIRTEIKEINQKISSIFICFGGSDPSGLTEKVVNALIPFNGIKKMVALGQGFLYKDTLRKKTEKQSEFEVYDNPKNLATLMNNADLAICAPGITMYELIYLGIPTITLCATEEQNKVATLFEGKG